MIQPLLCSPAHVIQTSPAATANRAADSSTQGATRPTTRSVRPATTSMTIVPGRYTRPAAIADIPSTPCR